MLPLKIVLTYARSAIVFEFKLKGTTEQYRALDEALRTVRFVRKACLQYGYR